MTSDTLLLESSDVRAIVDRAGRDSLMDTLIERITRTICDYEPDVTQIPARDGVQYQASGWGLMEWMPAHFGRDGTTVKLVGYHPANPERRGLPTVLSTVCAFDSASGHLVGLVDGTFLTALRTGAASAIASSILALPDSRTLGIVGCGAQAVTQIHGLSRLFAFDRIMAFDTRQEVAETLADRAAFLDVPVEPVSRESLPDMLAACDILCTCTSAAPGEGPVIPDCPTRPHVHVNAVGSDFHGKFEIPVAMLRRSLVCPDFREQAQHEGECQQLEPDEIGPDLSTLVRRADDYLMARMRSTVFDSTGWALEDHVAAQVMFDYARELGLGRLVSLECVPPDPKDPYSLLPPRHAVVAASRRVV
jgi:ornithine cyclodeaminase/alanine dehydrogenase-like protein (mu-crystallin family)